jgi:hypothetical protein
MANEQTIGKLALAAATRGDDTRTHALGRTVHWLNQIHAIARMAPSR